MYMYSTCTLGEYSFTYITFFLWMPNILSLRMQLWKWAFQRLQSHWTVLRHPMPFVFFVLICDAWEIYLMFCKQRGQEYSYPFVHIKLSIPAMHCVIKTYRQKAWDDGVAPSDHNQLYIFFRELKRYWRKYWAPKEKNIKRKVENNKNITQC